MQEKQALPKFKTEFLSDDLPAGPLAEELRGWCVKFIKKGLMPEHPGGAFGNLSFRAGEGSDEFVITASGLKDVRDPAAIVTVASVDLKDQRVSARGAREPSSETMLHYLIYRDRQDVNAVFHGHCAELLERAAELGLPVTEREEDFGTVQLAERAAEALKRGGVIMLRGHGFVSIGRSMKEAGERAFEALKK